MPRAGAPLQFRGIAALGGPANAADFGTLIEFIRETGPHNRTLAAVQNMDVGPAVNVGAGIVGLPLTGHNYPVGSEIVVAGTVAYDGAYVVQAGGGANQINVVAAFAAEAFTGAETVQGVTADVRIRRRYRALSVDIMCPGDSPEAVFYSTDNKRSWTRLQAGAGHDGQHAADRMFVGSAGGTGTYEINVTGI